jgi:hypothetical protein
VKQDKPWQQDKPVKPDKIRRLSQLRASPKDVGCQVVVALCELLPDGAPSLCVPIDGSIASPMGAAHFLPASLPTNGAATTATTPTTPRCGLYVGSRECDPSTGRRIGSVEFASNGEVRFDLDRDLAPDGSASPSAAWSFRKRVSVRVYDAAGVAARHPPRWSDDEEASAVFERSIADSDVGAAVTSLVLPYDAEAAGVGGGDHYYIVAHGTVCPAAPLDSSKVATGATASAAA